MACQWLAWRLRLPAILLLLAVGLLLGPGSDALAAGGVGPGRLIDPNALFGELLLPLVSLSVALILFEGGLTLDASELKQGGAVVRLILIGAPVTWALATAAAVWTMHFPTELAVLLGAILVVTGPTVIGPLLRFVRPSGVVAPILRWEGIIIDPIGALLALIVFEIVSSGHLSGTDIGVSVFKTLGIGSAVGLVAAGLLMLLLRRGGSADHLHNPLAVALVLITFAGSNTLQHESGLAAVTVMGIAAANQRRVEIEHVLDFKESLSVLLVSSLFVLLSSQISLAQVKTLDWGVAAFVLLLVAVVRPVSVAMATVGTGLTWRERAFLALMAPRGIVAASVASVFALQLAARHVPQADRLVPVTFAIVAGTVLVYGLGSPAVSRWLGLSRPGERGVLIAGADALARNLATAIQREGYDVLMIDSNLNNVREARLAGLSVMHANVLSRDVVNAVALSSIGRLLALTPSGEVNKLAALRYIRHFGRDNVYQLADKAGSSGTKHLRGDPPERELFGAGVTHGYLAARAKAGAVIKTTRLTTAFDFAAYRRHYGSRAMVLLVIDEHRLMHVVTSEDVLAPRPGETLISLVNPTGDSLDTKTERPETRA